MSDASFIFSTNIKQVVAEIRSGMSALAGAASAAQGIDTGAFVKAATPGVTRLLEERIRELRQAKKEAEQLTRTGAGLPPGRAGFAGTAAMSLRGIDEAIGAHLQQVARDLHGKGASLSGVNLNSIRDQIVREMVAPIANQVRDQIRRGATSGTGGAVDIYGDAKQIKTPRSRANLGSIEDLTAQSDRRAASTSNATARRIENARARSAKAEETIADAKEKGAREATAAAAPKARRTPITQVPDTRVPMAQLHDERLASAVLGSTVAASEATVKAKQRSSKAAQSTAASDETTAGAAKQVADATQAEAKQKKRKTPEPQTATGSGGQQPPKPPPTRPAAAAPEPEPSRAGKPLPGADSGAEARAAAAAAARIAEARRLAEQIIPVAKDVERQAKRGVDWTGARVLRTGMGRAYAQDTPEGTQYYVKDPKTGGLRQLDAERERARILEIAEIDRANKAAAQETLEKQKVIQAEQELYQLLKSEALGHKRVQTAAAVAPNAPRVQEVTRGSFIDNTSATPRYWDATGRGRVRELDPTNEADRLRIAELREIEQVNRAEAVGRARVEALREHAQREEAANAEAVAAERRYAAELRRLAERLGARERQGQEGPSTGVFRLPGGYADTRNGTPQYYEPNPANRGGVRPVTDPETLAQMRYTLNARTSDADSARVRADNTARERAASEEARAANAAQAAETRRLAQQRAAEREASREATAAERELTRQLHDTQRRGVMNNFLSGINNPGFGGSTSFNGSFDGLARSAGQAVKYSVLYSALNDLQQAAAAAAREFLDYDDSITELNIAMETAGGVAFNFTAQLQDVAALGGFNVGEAMDVAASGIRAFRAEAEQGGIDVEQMGTAFATQASRLAVLSKTTLGDAAGNLKAVASGYDLAPNDVGFTQVTDAIAGAKLAGGGDEKQIFQGLANSALILKEMGFSLNEAATIISKVNAQTDQSGQLIANRLSRLSTIVGGSTGRGFISQINAGLGANEKIDVNGSTRDQVVQLSEAYAKMGDAQRKAVAAGMGGTANARELVILLEEMAGISKEVSTTSFNGKGLEEFKKRLENVRSTLTQIGGDIKAVIVNLAAAGLADPFVILIDTLKPITSLLREITQLIATFTNAFGPLKSIVTTVLALAGALKLVNAARAAGGVGNLLLAQEARFAPTRAVARDQLARRAEIEARAATRAAPGAVVNPAVLAAARAQARAAEQLTRAEAAQRSVIAAPRSTAAEREAAQQRATQARSNLGLRQGELTRAQQDQSNETARARRLDARRETVARPFQRTDTRIAERIATNDAALAAARTGGGGRANLRNIEALESRRATLDAQRVENQTAFNRALAGAEARELATRNAANSARVRAGLRDAGIGPGLAGTARAAAGAAGRAGAGLVNLMGGPAMAAIIGGMIALTVGSKLIETNTQINKSTEDAAKTLAKPLENTAQALHDAAAENLTAATNMEQARSGFFGGLVDLMNGDNNNRQEATSKWVAQRQQDSATAIDELRKTSATSSDAEQLANAIDTTSVDTVAQSLKALGDEGQSASERMDALAVVLKNMSFVGTSSTEYLTQEQKKSIAANTGNATGRSIAQRLDDAKKVERDINNMVLHNVPLPKEDADKLLTSREDLKTFEGLDGKKIAEITDRATQDLLSQDRDLSSKASEEAYRTILMDGLSKAGIPPEKRQAIIDAAVESLKATTANEKNDMGTIDKFKSVVVNMPAIAQSVGEEAAVKAKLDAMRSGQVDDSAMIGINAQQTVLQQRRAEAQVAAQALIAKGEDPEALHRYIGMLDTELNKIEIAKLQEVKTRAQRDISVLEKKKQKELVGVTTAKGIEAIIAKYASLEFDKAAATYDIDTLISWIESSDKATVEAKKKFIDAAVAKAQAEYDRLVEMNAHMPEADRVDLTGVTGARDSALALQAAFGSAYGQATPGASAKEATPAQLLAQQHKTTATQNRDSLGLLRANVEGAAADLAAAEGAMDQAKAAEALAQAQNALADGLQAAKNAVDDINAWPESALDTANRAVRDAKQNLDKFAKGTQEWAQAQAAYVQSLRKLAEEQANTKFLQMQAGSDLTDPVAQARIELDKALEKRARHRKQKAPADVRAQDDIDVKNAQNQSEAAQFQQRFSDAQTAEQLGRISHAAYLKYLQSEHNRLSAIKVKTQQQKDELDQIDLAIKSAVDTMNGQWNLGDIKVPTVYEVRRALKNDSAATSTVNNPVTANTTNTTININGADISKVEAVLKRYLGASDRFTPSTRKA